MLLQQVEDLCSRVRFGIVERCGLQFALSVKLTRYPWAYASGATLCPHVEPWGRSLSLNCFRPFN
jgi:hypothetical protein